MFAIDQNHEGSLPTAAPITRNDSFYHSVASDNSSCNESFCFIYTHTYLCDINTPHTQSLHRTRRHDQRSNKSFVLPPKPSTHRRRRSICAHLSLLRSSPRRRTRRVRSARRRRVTRTERYRCRCRLARLHVSPSRIQRCRRAPVPACISQRRVSNRRRTAILPRPS